MANEQEKTDKAPAGKAAQNNAKPKSKVMLLGVMSLVVAISGAGGGLLAAKLAAGPQQAAAATPEAAPEAEGGHGNAHGATTTSSSDEDDKYAYVELDPVIVNLDEHRLLRYVRASVMLELDATDKKQLKSVEELLERRKPLLKNRLTLFLAGRTPEEVRGDKALRHLERQIMEMFNEELWPEGKGQIHDVLFKEFAVQ